MRKMWQKGGEALFDDISDAKGDEIQRLSVIQTLPTLLAEDPQACIQRLIPMMQETLPSASTEFHVAASSTFKTILEQRLVSDSVFTQTFLQKILSLLNHKDQIVAHTWLETLPDVIDLLPIDVVARKILPVAISKGQLSQPVESRIVCCKLLGRICTRFDSQMIKKDVLPTVHSLCQDENSDVRACICLQLHFVAEGLGPELVKSLLLSLIIELANDEEAIVRQASVQTIVHLLPHFQANVLKSAISPLFKKLCENSLQAFDSVTRIIAEEFGKIVIGLEKCLTASEKTWFLKYFQQLAQIGISKHITTAKKNSFAEQEISVDFDLELCKQYLECRRLCAFNIPAMFFLFASSTPEDVDILLSTFSALAHDSLSVKRAIACGIHEVAKLLGPKCHLIKKDFMKLLDHKNKILQGLIPHIAQTIELIIQSNKTTETEHEDLLIAELGAALLKCENEIFTSNNWRSSKSMLEQLEILPKLFSSEYIYTNFVPVAFKRALTTKPIPVRLAAGRLILVFTRYNLKPQQRNSIRNRIYTDFARNQSSYVRMLFLHMMVEAMAIFSSNYFKEHFYSIVLSLSDDLIANIRFKLVTLLPTLKSYLRLPSDRKLLSSFESTIRNLMNNEKDHDVIFALTNTIRELDKIDVRHEGQTSSAKMSKQDLEDLRKFEEEKELEAITGGKSSPIGQLAMTIEKGLLTSGRTNVSDGTSSYGSKQSTIIEGPSKSSLSTTQKAKQTGVTESVTESSFKATRQTTGFSQSFDPSKSSTSSDNLTSSWVRLTSNRMLLTQLWEKIDQPESTNSSYNSTNTNIDDGDDFVSNMSCGCSNTPSFVYPNPSTLETESNRLNLTGSCSCDNLECKKTFHSFLKHNYFDFHSRASPLHLLTHSKESRYEHIHNYFSPSPSRESVYDDTNSPNFAALRAVTNAAHYNSCWAFSSMPEIPVTLLDDEFLVDTGVRIPAQLSSSQSTSKIPNLQDIIYRNTRINNKFDKSNKIVYTPLKQRLTSVDQKSNRLSGNFDSRFASKVQMRDNLKDKRYSVMPPKSHSNSETSQSQGLDDKSKRSSFTMDREVNRYTNYVSDSDSKVQMRINSKDKRYSVIQTKARSNSESCQSKVLDDKAKRSSYASDRDVNDKFKKCLKTGMTSYDNEGPIFSRYSKQNFKRHSVEVTDYAPVNRMNTLKRNFTLDVNHNQGTSKIPLRKSIIASGSRTAPVTRASSPIRWGPQLSFEADHQPTKYSEPNVSCSSDHSSDDETNMHGYKKFTSRELSNLKKEDYTKDWINKLPGNERKVSSKEFDNLCSKFADVGPTYATKGEYLQDWMSKLPVWNPHAKKNM
ncbi:serine/threonine-protein phosphatase 4 regulatory subunit 4-like isoform X1 [Chelonus insularis]|uniref:serine/threonine-protein phosphatase 4 regulatory subunit 4-like isoform X1 n=1 Tax=Chelonus insularis TaxID=460826 RepID=UPI00158F2630|nr:serine/threonine-protein phosphatase 4 regulatory subunit 4-like isoform X1 [Chelonus insularis]